MINYPSSSKLRGRRFARRAEHFAIFRVHHLAFMKWLKLILNHAATEVSWSYKIIWSSRTKKNSPSCHVRPWIYTWQICVFHKFERQLARIMLSRFASNAKSPLLVQHAHTILISSKRFGIQFLLDFGHNFDNAACASQSTPETRTNMYSISIFGIQNKLVGHRIHKLSPIMLMDLGWAVSDVQQIPFYTNIRCTCVNCMPVLFEFCVPFIRIYPLHYVNSHIVPTTKHGYWYLQCRRRHGSSQPVSRSANTRL